MVKAMGKYTRSIWISLALLLAALACIALAPSPVGAQTIPGAVLIWPVNPVIEADRQAGALWLENPGKTPVTLQVRIYAWAQADGKNVYAEQTDVFGTPPIVTIAPGEKQLVRLTRTTPPPTGYEAPYRIVIDEIPLDTGSAGTGTAVAFRMRYSLPLFVLGETAARQDAKALPPLPGLAWRIVGSGSDRQIEISNTGPVHARLTEARFGSTPQAAGLLGYVLPGQTMRWPLSAGSDGAGFTASVNGAPAAPIARRAD